ncbi:MAG: oxidoreductase [Actinobacteria bacterium]|nr:oxidoreductase [Actinomycetota bacterium]
MKKWNLIIDVGLCHDCNDCFLADKDEFVGNDFPPYSAAQPWSGHRWMNIERKERGQYPLVQVAYLPMPCMHCDHAPCLTPDGAVYKREDGLVIIDPVKAKGREDIVESCPYGAIYWNEEASLPQKCTGCVHLLEEGWSETRCSQVCPTGAIRLVLADDTEMARIIAAEGLEPFRADLGTKPRVLYKNLYRWDKVFVAASVAYEDTDECAENAQVRVAEGGTTVGEGATNNYGEFTVDRLEPDGRYEVSVTAAGYKPYTVEVTLEKSLNLGLILLQKA